MRDFKAKLIKTTNEKIKKYENEIRYCHLGDVLIMFNENGNYIKTSTIVNVKENKNIMEIETLNSIYTLEVIS